MADRRPQRSKFPIHLVVYNKMREKISSTMLAFALAACVIVLSIYWTRQPTAVDIMVPTKNGIIQGVRFRTQRFKKEYISFRGIPYAKPPIGDLRFKVSIYREVMGVQQINEFNDIPDPQISEKWSNLLKFDD